MKILRYNRREGTGPFGPWHPILFLEVGDLLEREFQSNLIRTLKDRFPGCIVLKNDPTYVQGVPDLTVFYKNKWATLECKKSWNFKDRPNQRYYVDLMDSMSFSAFIFPENEEAVLNELDGFFMA